MRVSRALWFGGLALILGFGSPAFVAGCGDSSNSTGAVIDVSKAEKEEQERNQKAQEDFMKKQAQQRKGR
jgi:hypothetical protein